MIGILIDIGIVVIVILCTFLGYKRGFVKVAIGIIAFILSLVITIILFRPITNIVINNTQIDNKIADIIYEKIKDEDIEKSNNEIINFANKYILEDARNTSAKFIAQSVSETIVEVIVFIGLMIILRIVIFIVTQVLSLIVDLPILKQFNKLGGMIYGILQGIIINYAIFAIILVVVPLIGINHKELDDNINSSKIGYYMYNENIILKLLK